MQFPYIVWPQPGQFLHTLVFYQWAVKYDCLRKWIFWLGYLHSTMWCRSFVWEWMRLGLLGGLLIEKNPVYERLREDLCHSNSNSNTLKGLPISEVVVLQRKGTNHISDKSVHGIFVGVKPLILRIILSMSEVSQHGKKTLKSTFLKLMIIHSCGMLNHQVRLIHQDQTNLVLWGLKMLPQHHQNLLWFQRKGQEIHQWTCCLELRRLLKALQHIDGTRHINLWKSKMYVCFSFYNLDEILNSYDKPTFICK